MIKRALAGLVTLMLMAAPAIAAEGGHAESGENNLFAGDIGNAAWTVIIFVLVLVGMYAHGTPYYSRLRTMLGASEGNPPISKEALATYLNSRVPEALSGIGGLGLLVLVWLMVMKPG